MSLYVCSVCNYGCANCGKIEMRKADPHYQMSIEELKQFIYSWRKSGYRPYRTLVLTGGEPLMWENLNEGAELLKRAGVSKRLDLFTNGLIVENVTSDLLSGRFQLRISRYKRNEENVKTLCNKFGKKVRVVNQQTHYIVPKALHPEDTIPCACKCQGLFVYDWNVYACTNLIDVYLGCKQSLGEIEKYKTSLQPGYHQALSEFPRANHIFCRGCIANKNLGERMKRV